MLKNGFGVVDLIYEELATSPSNMPEENETLTSYSWKRDPLPWIYSILMFLPIIMVFIFYNFYNLDFLVCSGWILLFFSIVIIFLAGGEFRQKGGAPEGESIVHTTIIVDSGVYAVIRHPQYFGFILLVLSLVLMSQHWFSVISGGTGIALFYIDVRREEKNNLMKFGDAYRHYMKEVPRMNFLIGVLRLLQRRRTSLQGNSN
jgi:protein-S-isoprenylcysteine O-methyltransferase Ste14